MKSMTGYGRGNSSGEGFNITVELKTVNNRFLDINLRLPNELQQAEQSVKRLISTRLSRGRVDVAISYERNENLSFELNRPLIKGYLETLKQISEEFSIGGEPDINVIARLPNAIIAKRDEPGTEFTQGLEMALSAALDDLEQMRSTEGEMLREVLNSLLSDIESQIPKIESEAAGIREELRQKLERRIAELLSRNDAQIEIDQGRLAQEIAYLADRSDISEEIARLKTHLEHFRAIMNDSHEVGKRLDFLTQELNREANTITSKTGNPAIKEVALRIKSDIEKIREQVQNVE